MRVKVKICGFTNLADAQAAVEAGADVLGFVFHEPSPRFASIEVAAGIIRELPPFIIKAGVFVNAPEEFVFRAIRECGLNLLQFHGDEPPDYCHYPTDAWLLDAYNPDRLGGTGETFSWELAREAQTWGRPIFLAGGLTPENVAKAIRCARPYGVDVSSGVEAAPGRKDHAKVKAFIQAAQGVEV
jgi:phosphoribosylanthranilate isomerase